MIKFKPNWIQMKTRSYVFKDRNKMWLTKTIDKTCYNWYIIHKWWRLFSKFLRLVNGFFVFSFLSKRNCKLLSWLDFLWLFSREVPMFFHIFLERMDREISTFVKNVDNLFSISWIIPLAHVTFCLANSGGISAERLLGVWYTYCKGLKAVQNTSVITMNDLTLDPWFMIFFMIETLLECFIQVCCTWVQWK